MPHILGVPRFFYRKAPRELGRMLLSAWRGDRVQAFDAELWLWFFAGVVGSGGRIAVWRGRPLRPASTRSRSGAKPGLLLNLEGHDQRHRGQKSRWNPCVWKTCARVTVSADAPLEAHT